MSSNADLATAFDRSNPARLRSALLDALWQKAYGSSYAAEVRPNAFYTAEILATIERHLGSARNEFLIDLGCGHGGAGLSLAQRLGMRLIGIDLSPLSVALATERADGLGLGDRAAFQVGDAAATGVGDASCAAVICLDVLLYVPDKLATLREVARILRPGGCFGFTTWEQDGYSNRLGAVQVGDHRPLLEASGFDLEVFEEPQNWRRQQRNMLEAVVAHERDLSPEMGEQAASFLATIAREALKELPSRRYVFRVAKRRSAR